MIEKLENLVTDGKIRYFQVCFDEECPKDNYKVVVLKNDGMMLYSEDDSFEAAIKAILKDINEEA